MGKKKVYITIGDKQWAFPTKNWLLNQEREVLGFNLTSIMEQEALKINHYQYDGLSKLKAIVEDNVNTENLLIVAKIHYIETKKNKRDIPFYWILVEDDYLSMKIFCNNTIYDKYITELTFGKICLFSVNIKNGFIALNKCRLLENIPFKQNTIFQIQLPYGNLNNFNKVKNININDDLPYNFWTSDILNYIEDNIDITIQKGNCQVYQRTFQTDLFIIPTQELIDIIKNKFGVNCVLVDKENMFGNKKLIEEYINNN